VGALQDLEIPLHLTRSVVRSNWWHKSCETTDIVLAFAFSCVEISPSKFSYIERLQCLVVRHGMILLLS